MDMMSMMSMNMRSMTMRNEDEVCTVFGNGSIRDSCIMNNVVDERFNAVIIDHHY